MKPVEIQPIRQITNLQELQAEKMRLHVLMEKQKEILASDVDYLKEKFAPLALLNKAATTVVPEPVRRSSILNDSINFLAKKIFHNDHVVSTHSDQGKGNVVRNVALGILETVGSIIITRYIGRKIF